MEGDGFIVTLTTISAVAEPSLTRMVNASEPLYPEVGAYVRPEGVIEVEPDAAVVGKPPRLPCDGADKTVQVSVWLELASLTTISELMEVALAFWHRVRVVLLPLANVGAVLDEGSVKEPLKMVMEPEVADDVVQLAGLFTEALAAATVAKPEVAPV